ncbi:MAG TPA: hypothetical protein VFJ47_10750 [Terriglobales bacterium]|nr:hypothetical protein [Terriglobales bacterium]
MRSVLLACVVLMLAGMVFGQATVVGGWGTNLGWAGYYPAPPFIPVITTPGYTFQSFSPSAGASNATFGLTAGATNSTLSMVTPATSNAYTAVVWYASSPQISSVAAEAVAPEKAERHHVMETGAGALLGPGVSEAVLTAKATRKPAQRTYTNQDVERMNQNNGLVKWDGKTEKI